MSSKTFSHRRGPQVVPDDAEHLHTEFMLVREGSVQFTANGNSHDLGPGGIAYALSNRALLGYAQDIELVQVGVTHDRECGGLADSVPDIRVCKFTGCS